MNRIAYTSVFVLNASQNVSAHETNRMHRIFAVAAAKTTIVFDFMLSEMERPRRVCRNYKIC